MSPTGALPPGLLRNDTPEFMVSSSRMMEINFELWGNFKYAVNTLNSDDGIRRIFNEY